MAEDTKTLAHQIKPGRCKKKASFEQARAWGVLNGFVYEKKADGRRYLLQIRPNGAKMNYLTSRRVGVNGNYVEKQDLMPFIRDFKFHQSVGLDTIIDGELVGKTDSNDAITAMKAGTATYIVWDILRFKGDDVTKWPLIKRRKLLLAAAMHFPEWITAVKQYTDPNALLDVVEREGGEGIVRKSLTANYGEEWVKVKDKDTHDVVIWGYEETKSADWKAKGWIGALLIGQWREAASMQEANKKSPSWEDEQFFPNKIKGQWLYFVDVGRVSSGLDFADRKEFSENRANYIGEVIEVEADKRFATGKFRHPRFKQLRTDKPAWECVFSTEDAED